MADEFIKGLAVFSGAGLVWMVLAAWFRTPSFEDEQLFGPDPEDPDLLTEIALSVADIMFWLAIIGAVTFWVVIPLGREAYAYWSERSGE